VSAGSRKRASLHALKLVGIRDHADKYPYELSGGQKQRVAIARAFVKNPDIIIADEPTAALDTKTSKDILDLLKDLCRTKLLIIATHNKSIVRDYGSRVIELKSGYTIKNELIIDPSKVRVDELDLIIDKELEEDYEIIEKLIDIEQHVSEENKDTVLKDLGVDLQDFRLNKQDDFSIDQELKYRLIKERQQNSKLNTRIYRFLQTSDNFHGKKNYANKSFIRNLGLHLFSSLIFTVFLLTLVFGLNFLTETFGGFNEKAMYSRTMNNENVLFFTDDEFFMDSEDQDLYSKLERNFIADFTQTEIKTTNFMDYLFIDPYFRYQYEQEKILYIENELIELGQEDIFAIYYNNSSVVLREENPEIIFDDLKYTYQNIVTNPVPFTYVTSFMNTDIDENLIYQFTYVFAESNEDILNDHLLEGSRLPDTTLEVAIPVSFLFDFEILNTSDFKDDNGQILEIIPSNLISAAFFELSESDRVIEITRNVITIEDDGDGYIESYTEVSEEFLIVGLVNFDGDINPFLEMRDDIFISNNASINFSFIFSSKASELVNFEIINNSVNYNFSKSIQYAEISKVNYELYDVDQIVKEFDDNYLNDILDNITTEFTLWIDSLNDASAIVATYVEADLAGLSPSGVFLDDIIDNELFPGFTYQDLLNYYVAQHLSVISSISEFDYICPTCDFTDRDFDEVLPLAESSYERLLLSNDYKDMLEVYGDVSRLTYQESTNRIIYEYYGAYFNNQFYESSLGDYYSLELVSSFARESGGILSLVYLVIPRSLFDFFSWSESIVDMIERLETNAGFISFMESTNLDLLISSVSTNAIRSVVMIVLYLVVYLILFISTIFLSVVLMNLYSNIYETATRKRIKELASLRILGTSYEDIHDMVKIENKRVAVFSYGSFLIILIILSKLNLFTDEPINHYYMPLLGLFFDFNLYDVFILNYFVIGIVSIVFYFFIYKFIIKRVSTKKILNIDTIEAIKDGENL
ncbi:MAG: ATP-binding cassette domain-containing protein, partial [Candidatus Izemoplasma sp.]